VLYVIELPEIGGYFMTLLQVDCKRNDKGIFMSKSALYISQAVSRLSTGLAGSAYRRAA